jgi:hypothetical protein
VLGVELSPLAVEQFFAEHGLRPDTRESRYGRHHEAGGIELVVGDAFGLDAGLLRDCAAVFDRAALIALPADVRLRYARGLYAALPEGCRGLLVTLEYPQADREGPPFSVQQDKCRRCTRATGGSNCANAGRSRPTIRASWRESRGSTRRSTRCSGAERLRPELIEVNSPRPRPA